LEDKYSTPNPPLGEALIRVHQAGVCETDIQLVMGTWIFVAREVMSSWAQVNKPLGMNTSGESGWWEKLMLPAESVPHALRDASLTVPTEPHWELIDATGLSRTICAYP